MNGIVYAKETNMEHPVEVETHIHNPSHDGGNLAGLAALMHRGSESNNGLNAALPLLLADRSRHNTGDWGLGGIGGGFGSGLVGGVLGGLLFGRRGGLGGIDGGDCGNGGAAVAAVDTVSLQTLSDLKALVPTTALQTQAAIQSQLSSNALSAQMGLSNLKDSVQAVGTVIGAEIGGLKDATQAQTLFLSNQLNVINANVAEQGCQTRAAVLAAENRIVSKIDANTIAELQARLARVENHGHARETEINVSQTVNQVQAQLQNQSQQQQILSLLSGLSVGLGNVTQLAHAANQNIIAGNSGSVLTGAQTSTPTNVNTR